MFEYLITDSQGRNVTLITARNPFDVFEDIADCVTIGEYSPANDSFMNAMVA